MKSYTIYNITEELSMVIEQLAIQNNESLNNTIKSLLHKATGISSESSMNQNLLKFYWTISREEADEFFENTKELSKIDKEGWE